ncbi:dihydropteroate synthase [Thiohalorhabdus methylotrophus]|uniref:Dihydropteroate synthase n=1 Tax=Thiohalorhabdus methylotrophus TaxID=3242694 RepID=A0ABV4TZR3_9GAMM
MARELRFKDLTLDLERPRIMGIVNVTPDSFSDGGRYADREGAAAHARSLVEAGADILDVGGESTRPGATEVPVQEELDRVIPAVEAVAGLGVPVSVDTRKAAVMREAVAAGATLINDVSALEHDPDSVSAAVELDVPVCLMHMQGTPETMQDDPRYEDVVSEVKTYLAKRMEHCQQAGIKADNILVDPGIGFGKTVEHNLALMHALENFAELGRPLLVGTSRKSLTGKLFDRAVHERTYFDAALVAWSVTHGADIVRVHDVQAMYDVVRMTELLKRGRRP